MSSIRKPAVFRHELQPVGPVGFRRIRKQVVHFDLDAAGFLIDFARLAALRQIEEGLMTECRRRSGGFSSGVALAMTSLRAFASSITLISDGVSSASVAVSSSASLALQKASTMARRIVARRRHRPQAARPTRAKAQPERQIASVSPGSPRFLAYYAG